MVERLVYTEEAVGSIPTPRTMPEKITTPVEQVTTLEQSRKKAEGIYNRNKDQFYWIVEELKKMFPDLKILYPHELSEYLSH